MEELRGSHPGSSQPTAASTDVHTGSKEAQRFVMVGAKRDGQRKDRLIPDNPQKVDAHGRAYVNTLSPAPERLANVLLTGSDALLYTAPCKIAQIIIKIVNVDTNSPAQERKATISHVAKGATATSDTNSLCKSRPIQVGFEEILVVPGMDQGESFYGSADSASKVTVHIYGLKVDK